MEPITHFLTGAALARAGFNRKTALATATMTLAAEAPDLDVFWSIKGPVYGFAHHRGFTHSFLGLILTSALVTAVMYLGWLVRGRKTNIPNLPPRWGLLFFFAYVAGLSHILLDYTNNYGVRPFWPFWEKWYSWDIVFIVEPALYIFLIGGLVLPLFFSRHEPVLRGRTAANVALLCVVLLYAARDVEHRRAVHVMESQRFDAAAPGQASAYPYYWNIFRWGGVAQMPTSFAIADVNSRSGELDRSSLEVLPKQPETPATLAAKTSYIGRVYLDWARYPYVTEEPSGEDAIVHFRDLRFNYGRFRGRGPLSCTVELDRNMHVVREAFGTTAQVPPVD